MEIRTFIEYDEEIEYIDDLLVEDEPFKEGENSEYYQATLKGKPVILEVLYIDDSIQESLVDMIPSFN